MMRPFRLVVLVAAGMILGATPAFADHVYHSENLPLSSIAPGYPLNTGHVINTHTNGPVNAAIEEYLLNGAKATSTFQVVLHLQAGDCTGAFLFPFPNGAFVSTDASGDGHGVAKVTPEEVAAFHLHGAHLGITWFFVDTATGTAAYESACSNVIID